MNLWLILVPCGMALLVVVGMLVLAACGVDGFHGDRSRPAPASVAAPVPAPRPALHGVTEGPLRVTAERVTQVEAA